MIGLNCEESSPEVRCCRYPLTVDFEAFGWDWIIAPKRYEANYCAGECPYVFMQKYPHTHLVQQASSPPSVVSGSSSGYGSSSSGSSSISSSSSISNSGSGIMNGYGNNGLSSNGIGAGIGSGNSLNGNTFTPGVTPAGPCCTPRKMSSISMLYFDENRNIVYGILPGMVVDRCGCT